MVLEQFIVQLPEGTAVWVQCHHSVSLDEAVQLSKGQPSGSISCVRQAPGPLLSLSLCLIPPLILLLALPCPYTM